MFIETIRYEHGRFHLLDLHQRRMEATVREAYGPYSTGHIPLLHEILHHPMHRDTCGDSVFKYRIIYDTRIRSIEYTPYIPRDIRSLMTVKAPATLDYHLKRSDRTALDNLRLQRGDCDEILIIKDSLITDTSYSNIIFKGTDGIYTPRAPLLAGVMRQHLLDTGAIIEYDLTVSDILPGNPLGITEAYMINAMLTPGAASPVPTGQIINSSAAW